MRRIIFSTIFCLIGISTLLSQTEEAILLGNWHDATLIGSNAHNNIYNDLWGYAINGQEYAIIGSTAGTHFIDVTDPKAPFEAHFVEGRSVGGAIIHRDYHEYKGFLYVVADEGGPSFQIMDLRQLPDTVLAINNENIGTTHNVFIDTTAARLYGLSSVLEIYDISNPENPIPIGLHSSLDNSAFRYFHDGYIDNNIAILNAGSDGLVVADLTDAQHPIVINSLTAYPSRGYNHSGWVSDDGMTYYFADETHNSPLKAVNISDLCDLEVGETFRGKSDEEGSIAHNLIVACDYLYVSYYYDGLQVFDISDRMNPKLITYYDTYPQANDRRYKGAWGVYPFLPSGNILLSDMQTGLYIFKGIDDNCNSSPRNITNLQSQSCSLTSTNDFILKDDVQISPNPATDRTSLIVNLSQTLDHLNISLLNLNGQQLQTWDYQNVAAGKNDFSILLPNSLAKGVYFLSLRNESFNLTKKLVIGQ